MRTYRDQVVVIKSRDYKEADKLLTLFGEKSGKFSVIAKGIRRITSKNRGNMQTLCISEISYYKGEGIPILLETEQVFLPDYVCIKVKNIERVLVLVNKLLPEEQENLKIYKGLISIIKRGFDIDTVNRFRILFLKVEGLLGDLNICSVCGKNDKLIGLNILNFTSICKSCYSRERLKKVYLKIGRDLYVNSAFTEALDRYIEEMI